MMFHHYYRTSSAAVIAARQADVEGSIVVERKGVIFADLFKAKPIFSTGFAPRFLGITFDKDRPCPNHKLWVRFQNPPTYALREGEPQKNLMPAWNALCTLWRENYPQEARAVRTSAVLTEMGVDEEKLKGHNVHYFEVGGYAYCACTLAMHNMTEITATQFLEAQEQAMKQEVKKNG